MSEPAPDLHGARVLVTGAGGFLGRHLVAALAAAGATVLGPRRAELDLRDAAATRAWMLRHGPSHVVHAAAVGGGIGWMAAHPADSLRDNLAMAGSVLDAAHHVGVKRFVGVSSACAYPGAAAQPMREDAIFDGPPEPTNGPYGHAKRMLLVQGAAMAAQYGFSCAFVVPTNLYGPGDDLDPARSHLVAALVRRFLEARRDGVREVACWGTGRATRDLLHVRDAAAGVVAALRHAPDARPINLGSGQERTTREIASAVASAVGWHGEIRWDETRPDGMPRKVLDTQRAREVLRWTPTTPLDVGLEETVAWARSQV
jgi:GDP-L-fucose synthase